MPPKKKEDKAASKVVNGMLPMSGITQKTMEKFGMDFQANSGLVTFSREKALEDIKAAGVFSDFQPAKQFIESFSEDEMVIIMNEDGDETGSLYWMCVSVDAKEREIKARKPQQLGGGGAGGGEEGGQGGSAAGGAGGEGGEAVVEEPEETSAPPKELQPPRPWEGRGSEVEMEASKIKSKRDLIVLSVSRKRRFFHGKARFNDEAGIYEEFRPYRDHNFELQMREREVEIQAVPSNSVKSVQTQWFRKINSSLQYEPMLVMNSNEMDDSTSQAVNAFLTKIVPICEERLWQNDTFDVFEDDFAKLGEEDATIGSNLDSSVKEYQSFTDITYSKNKVVSAIDWMPGGRGIVAVSCTEHVTFDDRVEKDGSVPISYILIWNFIDPIHPQFILEAPGDCYSFRFNPSDPTVLAAGCINGQTMFWELSNVIAAGRQKEKAATSPANAGKDDAGGAGGAGAGGTAEEEKSATAPIIKPTLTSTIEGSHKRSVTDLIWFDPDSEVQTRSGQRIPKSYNNGEQKVSFQYATIASDGMILFWDTRATRDDKNGGVLWTPIFRISLPAIEGAGDLGGMQLVVNPSTSELLTKFYCSSEEGELVMGDWIAAKAAQPQYAGGEKPEGEEGPPAISLDSFPAHFSPCVSLQRSPFFEDIILTVGDSTFAIFKEGLREPIIVSASASHALTGGRWSPTRPGVIVTTKADGSIEVWDLLDRSDTPSMIFDVASAAASSLEFWGESKSTQQLLAVGDEHGTLHILEMPRNLRRPSPHEEDVMRAYFDREVKRVGYIQERMQFRSAELVKRRAEEAEKHRAEEEAAHRAAEAAAAAAAAAGQVGDDGEPVVVKAAPPPPVEEVDVEAVKAEAEYQALEAEFRKQFNIAMAAA